MFVFAHLSQVYVLKRPHVDEFLQKMGELFECVLFTASLAKVWSAIAAQWCHMSQSLLTWWFLWVFFIQYADPVADLLDQWGVFRTRLFRESCVFHRGNYVKDLSRLGRELSKVIIIDNSPASYIFHPENAVSQSSAPCGTAGTAFFSQINLHILAAVSKSNGVDKQKCSQK